MMGVPEGMAVGTERAMAAAAGAVRVAEVAASETAAAAGDSPSMRRVSAKGEVTTTVGRERRLVAQQLQATQSENRLAARL